MQIQCQLIMTAHSQLRIAIAITHKEELHAFLHCIVTRYTGIMCWCVIWHHNAHSFITINDLIPCSYVEISIQYTCIVTDVITKLIKIRGIIEGKERSSQERQFIRVHLPLQLSKLFSYLLSYDNWGLRNQTESV